MNQIQFRLLAAIVAVALYSPTLSAAMIVVNEDFESYADTTAMTAIWGGGGLGTLSSAQAFSGSNSALHPGGTVNTYLPGIGTLDATATEDVLLTARIYDDGQFPSPNAGDRNTVGLRGGPFPLFEMGHFNSPAHYAMRAVLFGNGINPSWVAFTDGGGNAIASTEGWHTYQARFSLTGLTVTLDLQSDGTIDGTIAIAGNGNTYGGFTDLRFGGPSNNSSQGANDGSVYFDDIRLETVDVIPEPSTIVLGCLALCGGAALIRRRR